MSPLHPSAGLRVGGRYLLTDLVATGGMGEVWSAEDQVLGRVVAVKLLRREYAADDAFLGRFRAEARHAASIGHPGIAQVFDYGEDEGTAYLVMELVPGEPLSARLRREGALPAAVAVPLLQQAAMALDAAHATGLVHRDVKPGNLLITPDERVKITDFGIARAGDQAPLTRTGEVMGTAQYLSPEQAMGRTATPASDVYSLGIVAYETLSGRRPFEADTAVAIALAQVNNAPDPLPDTVPGPVAAVVLQALSKDPAERPASAAAFADSLGAALEGIPPATTRLAPVPPAELPPVALPVDAGASAAAEPEPPARRRGRGALGLALALLLVLGAAVAVALARGGATPTDPGPSTTVTTPASTEPTTASETSRSSSSSRTTSRTSSSRSRSATTSPSRTSSSSSEPTSSTSSSSSSSSSTSSPSSPSGTSSRTSEPPSSSSSTSRTSASPAGGGAGTGADAVTPTDVVAPEPSDTTTGNRSVTDVPRTSSGTPGSSGATGSGDTDTGDDQGRATRAAGVGGGLSTR